MKFLVKKFALSCINYLEKNNKVVYIKGQNNVDVYMVRYIVFKSKWISLYIHRFLHSDADTHHDHPWNFLTYVIEKGYKEELLKSEPNKGLLIPHLVDREPGSLAYRRAEDVHRVIIDKNYRVEDRLDAPLTLCVMLKRRRIWGFIKPTIQDRRVGHTWTNFKDYLNIDENHPDFRGSE